MKLTNEFTVAVPLERAWVTLLDIPLVAGFLPGAQVEPEADEGVYRGTMKVKVGPMVVNYRGTARLSHTDESAHIADIAIEAKDTRGQGTASAVIHNRLVPENGETRVIAETDLNITGRQAQFGRGVMQDVAGRMLGDFARRFEQHLVEADAAAMAGDGAPAETADGERAPAAEAPTETRQPEGAGPAPRPPAPPQTPEALDLGAALSGSPVVRRGVAGLALVLLALIVIGRRRSR
jgi:carbon monoxide dehydrogenase subunit G